MNCLVWRLLTIAVFCVFSVVDWQSQGTQGGPATISPPKLPKEEVLSRWADALGGRENLQNARKLHLRGTIETGGMKGSYERWTSSRGELRTAVDLSGVFRQIIVFDGQNGWIQDTNGTVHELTGDVLRGVVSSAYEASDSFLFSGRIPGQVEFAGADTSQGVYVFRLEPEHGSVVTVFLDEHTFLPQREETNGPMGKRVLHFSDWREFGGIKVPSTIRQSHGDAKFDALIRTEQVEINDAVSAGLFKRPDSAAEPIHFANGAHEAAVPAEVTGDHIYAPVRVNGSEAAWFFLDSGAGMSVVSQALAQKMGLKLKGTAQTKGTGAGSSSIGLAKKAVFDLPGIHVPPGTIAVWDLSSKAPMLGRQWDGVLGYDVISRLVVRVDYEHKEITFYDPATFVADKHATALPVTFFRSIPVVDAKITLPGGTPVDAKCAVDSGADGFHLSTPFTKANKVLALVTRTISASSVGAGGETKEFAGRIASLQLGPYLLREPITTFSINEKEGLLASSDIDALIGGRILKRFTVTFDYPHHRILLQPDGHFSEPFRANESGLSLLAKGADFRRFEIDDVEPGSPAELAGVEKGDILTEMNGHPAIELDLEKIDEILQQAGKVIPIIILRNGHTLKMRLNLSERI